MKENIFDKLDKFFNATKLIFIGFVGFVLAFVLAFFDNVHVVFYVVALLPMCISLLYIFLRAVFKPKQ